VLGAELREEGGEGCLTDAPLEMRAEGRRGGGGGEAKTERSTKESVVSFAFVSAVDCP